MSRIKPILAILLSVFMAAPVFAQTPEIKGSQSGGIAGWFSNNYRPRAVNSIFFEDSTRIDRLIRAGRIYLSLRDAIALALENNLDIENARLTPKMQDANLLRAQAGALLRNVNNSIAQGPSSASLGALAGANSLGATGSGSGGSSTGGVLSGLSVQLAGSAIPNYDPTLFVNGQYQHQTAPQTNSFVTGTNFLVTDYRQINFGVSQGFSTGTNVSLGMGNVLHYHQNAPSSDFNPVTQGALSFSVTQNLLNGFGRAVNNRAIHIAKNQQHISDLQFKQQVIATVNNVVGLYWDLVSFNDSLKIRQQTLELNRRLYEDNKRRAELGALAEIDIIQAEAEMKSSQQDVTNAETQVLQQEMILKNVLTRGGMNNPLIVAARIIPTDHFEVPQSDAIQPTQDMVAEAFQKRPEIEQSQVGLEDSRISMLGTKNNLLPSLSVFANLSNNGLSGDVNLVPVPITAGGATIGYRTRTTADVNPFFLGGYGTFLQQIFSRNFPNYSAGFQLNVPIRNRANQADLITDELNYRQQQIQDKQLQNNIKLNVVNAQTALRQARAAYDTSVEARKLQEQTLAGERRKYELGTSTILNVVLVQRDTTTRELAEVDAKSQYIKSRTAVDQVLGRTLEVYGVDVDEARKGVVSREPDMIPAVGMNRPR
ncbi:MAG TPA: TolC family protein [Candidatus Acidoferrales bacterium]|nr:TolC family protein [Candidatus Acidoferrales bacterium]